MNGLVSHVDLVDLLENISGSDWYRQSNQIIGTDHMAGANRTTVANLLKRPDIRPDPSGKIFKALFDLVEIQEIQDAFAQATGVASIITTTSGVPLTAPSRFCRLCNDVIRKTDKGLANFFRSDALIGRHNPDGATIRPCLSGGLWDAGASITAGRIHIANWLIGQVRNEDTDTESMMTYAGEIGADVDAFSEALGEVTVMSTERFTHVSHALFLMANQMSQRAFQNLQQTHLNAEMARMETIISRSPVIAIHWSQRPGWPVDYVSENVERVFGYRAVDFLAGRITYADIIHPHDLHRVTEEVINSSNSRHVDEIEHESYRIVAKDGSIRWVNDATRIIRDAGGEITGFEGIVIDVTERWQIATEKKALEQRLQRAEKMELIGTLAGGVAHDLNNILGGIVGYPDLLLLDLPEDSPLHESIKEIRDSGKKAAEIVQDLLTLARRGVMVTEVVNLNDIVASYLDSLEHRNLLATAVQVEIILQLDIDLLNVAGSPTHLSKAVMNLVRNAVEAMPRGGFVKIRTENTYLDRAIKGYDEVEEGDYVVLFVEDNGIGIAPNEIERICEPFYTRKVMGRSGTGLGMPVVWGTVKDHNGYVAVESEQDQGTTFQLFFPITRQERSGDPRAVPIAEYEGSGESILVIDDMPAQRRVASSLLEALGYRVSTVSSGEEALEFLSRRSVDLVLLDIILESGFDGFETYRRILEIQPGQKAVIASGYSETERVRKAQDLGAGPYIKKPYTIAKIGAAIKAALIAGD